MPNRKQVGNVLMGLGSMFNPQVFQANAQRLASEQASADQAAQDEQARAMMQVKLGVEALKNTREGDPVRDKLTNFVRDKAQAAGIEGLEGITDAFSNTSMTEREKLQFKADQERVTNLMEATQKIMVDPNATEEARAEAQKLYIDASDGKLDSGISSAMVAGRDPVKPIVLGPQQEAVNPQSGEIIAANTRQRGGRITEKVMTAQQLKVDHERLGKVQIGLDLLAEAKPLISPANVGLVGAGKRAMDVGHGVLRGASELLTGDPNAVVGPDQDRAASELKRVLQNFKAENWKEIVGPGGLSGNDQLFLNQITAQGLSATDKDVRGQVERLERILKFRQQTIQSGIDEFGGRAGKIVEVQGGGFSGLTLEAANKMSPQEIRTLLGK